MIKKIIIGLLAIGLFGGIYGYFQYNKEHRDIASEEASVQVDAIDLFQQFVDNETQANARYLDKVVKVSGVVSEVEAGKDSEMLVLKTEDDLFGVNVYFDQPQDIEQVIVGNQIVVKGHCTGGDEMGVVIAHASVIKNSKK